MLNLSTKILGVQKKVLGLLVWFRLEFLVIEKTRTPEGREQSCRTFDHVMSHFHQSWNINQNLFFFLSIKIARHIEVLRHYCPCSPLSCSIVQ